MAFAELGTPVQCDPEGDSEGGLQGVEAVAIGRLPLPEAADLREPVPRSTWIGDPVHERGDGLLDRGSYRRPRRSFAGSRVLREGHLDRGADLHGEFFQPRSQEFRELSGEPIVDPVLVLALHCQALLLSVFKQNVIRNTADRSSMAEYFVVS
jgi:hypothetical protein